MEDEIAIPYSPENEKTVSRLHEAEKNRKAGPPAEKLKPQDINDSAWIHENHSTGTTEKVDPRQVELDVVNMHKAFAMLNRTKDEDFNPELVNRVSDSFLALMKEVKAAGHLPQNIHIKFEAATRSFLVFSVKAKEQIDIRLHKILAEPAGKENEKTLNELSKMLSKLYRAEEFMHDNSSEFELSSDTLRQIQEEIDESRKLEEKLIHAATLKGYTINDMDSAAKMAEEESNEYNFVIKDKDQEKLLTTLKSKCQQLLTDLTEYFADIRDMKSHLNETLTKMRLAEKKRELADLEKLYVRKLHEKKLKNKLKAEVIVLAYLLKNPTSLNFKRIDEIKSEINKIRWQTIPGYSS